MFCFPFGFEDLPLVWLLQICQSQQDYVITKKLRTINAGMAIFLGCSTLCLKVVVPPLASWPFLRAQFFFSRKVLACSLPHVKTMLFYTEKGGLASNRSPTPSSSKFPQPRCSEAHQIGQGEHRRRSPTRHDRHCPHVLPLLQPGGLLRLRCEVKNTFLHWDEPKLTRPRSRSVRGLRTFLWVLRRYKKCTNKVYVYNIYIYICITIFLYSMFIYFLYNRSTY